jgi:DAACS family dicarboxylate/amino acid:cation (Na+ or H+) symporter
VPDDAPPPPTVPDWHRRAPDSRRLPLHTKIFIGMLAGALAGVAANLLFGKAAGLQAFVANVTLPAGKIFLRLIFMVVIPLILSAIILGVAELGDPRHLGRVGLKTLLFTVVLSTISVLLGVGFANLVRPGAGMSEKARGDLIDVMRRTSGELPPPAAPKTPLQTLLDLVPENPVEAMANAFRGDMIAVMVFALVLGVALTLVERRKVEPLLQWLQALLEGVMRVIDFAMLLAPYGVAALLFTVTALTGLDVLARLGLYVATVLVALALHQFVTYALVVRYLAAYPPRQFYSRIREVMVTAFSTSSSNATLPTTLRVAEHNLGIPRSIGGFVLTLGSTLNQNGTALYEGVTVLFLAQFFGVPLTLGQQVIVVLLSILAGIGTAGVPGGSLPLVTALLVTIGVPPEGIGIILGVDRLLDMCRTVLNVTGDLTVAACVAHTEGHILKQ